MGDTSGGIATRASRRATAEAGPSSIKAEKESEESMIDLPKYEAVSIGDSDSDLSEPNDDWLELDDEDAKEIKFKADDEDAKEIKFKADDEDAKESKLKTDDEDSEGDSDDESTDGNEAGSNFELAEPDVLGDKLWANDREVDDDDYNDGSDGEDSDGSDGEDSDDSDDSDDVNNDDDSDGGSGGDTRRLKRSERDRSDNKRTSQSDSKNQSGKCLCGLPTSHRIKCCPEKLQQCRACKEAPRQYTDFELRVHYKQDHPELEMPEPGSMSLDEEITLICHGSKQHGAMGAWQDFDALPGRNTTSCGAWYRSLKPKGSYSFDIKAEKGVPSNALNNVYRGLLTCCHHVNRLLAELWMKHLDLGPQSGWWPKDVRPIENKDSLATQNELTALLSHLLGIVIRQDAAAQDAGLTLPKLKDLTYKEIEDVKTPEDPMSEALRPALSLVFQLAEWEMNQEASAFQETLQVQCGSRSRFRQKLKTCFGSHGRFEGNEYATIPTFETTLDNWMQRKLKGSAKTQSTILEQVKNKRNRFEAAYNDERSSIRNYKIGSWEEFECFLHSQFNRCTRSLLAILTQFLTKSLRPGPATGSYTKAPSWWLSGMDHASISSLNKEELILVLNRIFGLVLKQDPVVKAVQVNHDVLIQSAFTVFIVANSSEDSFLPLEAISQVTKGVRHLGEQSEWGQGVDIQILEEVSIAADGDATFLFQKSSEFCLLHTAVKKSCTGIPRTSQQSVARAFNRALFNLHDVPLIYKGAKPFFWAEGVDWKHNWYDNNQGVWGIITQSFAEHIRHNKVETLMAKVWHELVRLSESGKRAFEEAFRVAEQQAAEIARQESQRQDRTGSASLPAASPSASPVRSDLAQRERALQDGDGSPQPKRRRRASDDEGSETFARKKQRTQGAERMARIAVQGVQTFLEALKEEDDPWEVARMARNMLDIVIKS